MKVKLSFSLRNPVTKTSSMKKYLAACKRKKLSERKIERLCHLGGVDNLAGGGNIKDIEDAVAVVRVELKLGINFIVFH